jgi:biopolymer transport protein TolR
MAMQTGSGDGPRADINVTPLIDVLLVLLIIFMVITPLTPTGLDALVPQPPRNPQQQTNVDERTIVVQILGNRALKINQEDITLDRLQGRLEDIYKTRAEKVAFVKGDENLTFADVATVIDKVHAAGVDKVGLITARIEAGQ